MLIVGTVLASRISFARRSIARRSFSAQNLTTRVHPLHR